MHLHTWAHAAKPQTLKTLFLVGKARTHQSLTPLMVLSESIQDSKPSHVHRCARKLRPLFLLSHISFRFWLNPTVHHDYILPRKKTFGINTARCNSRNRKKRANVRSRNFGSEHLWMRFGRHFWSFVWKICDLFAMLHQQHFSRHFSESTVR